MKWNEEKNNSYWPQIFNGGAYHSKVQTASPTLSGFYPRSLTLNKQTKIHWDFPYGALAKPKRVQLSGVSLIGGNLIFSCIALKLYSMSHLFLSQLSLSVNWPLTGWRPGATWWQRWWWMNPDCYIILWLLGCPSESPT